MLRRVGQPGVQTRPGPEEGTESPSVVSPDSGCQRGLCAHPSAGTVLEDCPWHARLGQGATAVKSCLFSAEGFLLFKNLCARQSYTLPDPRPPMVFFFRAFVC